MIDHITLLVKDYDRSRDFYIAALAPLGYALITEITREMIPDLPFEKAGGLGADGKPDLWLRPSASVVPTHLAFSASRRGLVDAFHAAALAAGAEDNGPPGLRPQYHPNYYGAFVIDPDGYNVEVVCHAPE